MYTIVTGLPLLTFAVNGYNDRTRLLAYWLYQVLLCKLADSAPVLLSRREATCLCVQL
jgi:hypothetical protein